MALLQTHGLTGLTFVELTGGSRDAPSLKAQHDEKFPVIRTGPSLMTRLDISVTALLGNLNRTSQNINALLDEDNRNAIKHTLKDLETLSHTLASHQGRIDSSLNEVSNFTGELPHLVRRMEQSADAIDHMAKEVGGAAASTRSTMDSTRQFTSETLPEVHQLVLELRDLTVSLRRFSGELEQNPGILLHGKAADKRGPGE